MPLTPSMMQQRFHPSQDPPEWFRAYALSMGWDTNSGVTVNPDTAMRVTAALACIRIIADTESSLPFFTYRNLPNGGKDKARDHYLYPLLHEVPVDKCDFSVIKSSWDPGFYRMYATKETFKPQAGTREMLELKNFFGTKIMKTPAVVRLESFTTREYSGIVPTLDGAKPDQFAEELVFIKDNKKITGIINLKKRLLRYLVEDGANAEFVRLLMSEFGTGDPDTFNDDVIDYLTLNIIPTYETKVVDLYIKKVKQPGGTYGQNTVRGDLSDVQKLLDGYKLDKNFKVTKKADLIYTFEYQIDKSFGAELAPSFTIGKI